MKITRSQLAGLYNNADVVARLVQLQVRIDSARYMPSYCWRTYRHLLKVLRLLTGESNEAIIAHLRQEAEML